MPAGVVATVKVKVEPCNHLIDADFPLAAALEELNEAWRWAAE